MMHLGNGDVENTPLWLVFLCMVLNISTPCPEKNIT